MASCGPLINLSFYMNQWRLQVIDMLVSVTKVIDEFMYIISNILIISLILQQPFSKTLQLCILMINWFWCRISCWNITRSAGNVKHYHLNKCCVKCVCRTVQVSWTNKLWILQYYKDVFWQHTTFPWPFLVKPISSKKPREKWTAPALAAGSSLIRTECFFLRPGLLCGGRKAASAASNKQLRGRHQLCHSWLTEQLNNVSVSYTDRDLRWYLPRNDMKNVTRRPLLSIASFLSEHNKTNTFLFFSFNLHNAVKGGITQWLDLFLSLFGHFTAL